MPDCVLDLISRAGDFVCLAGEDGSVLGAEAKPRVCGTAEVDIEKEAVTDFFRCDRATMLLQSRP